jgi:hypothetical protein
MTIIVPEDIYRKNKAIINKKTGEVLAFGLDAYSAGHLMIEKGMNLNPDHVLVDGLPIPILKVPVSII